jgi:hypothetical protein
MYVLTGGCYGKVALCVYVCMYVCISTYINGRLCMARWLCVAATWASALPKPMTLRLAPSSLRPHSLVASSLRPHSGMS